MVRSPFASRIAVTLGALLLVQALSHVPLPGIVLPDSVIENRAYLAEFVSKLSVVTLDVWPYYLACLLHEFWRTLTNDDLTKPASSWAHRLTLIGALLFAALQGWSLAIGLESQRMGDDPIVPDPGWLFRFGVVTTLVAATAMIAWLADIVTRAGIGNGIWLFVAVSFVQTQPAEVRFWRPHLESGFVTVPWALSALAIYAALLVALVTLDAARTRRGDTLTLDPWPTAFVVQVWIALTGVQSLSLFPFDNLVSTVLMPCIVALLVMLRAWKWGRADQRMHRLKQSVVPAAIAAMACVLIGAMKWVFNTVLYLPFPAPDVVVVVTAIALACLRSAHGWAAR
jgi:hypothetical protein